MSWLKNLFRASESHGTGTGAHATTRRVTLKNPLVISSPTIGFLNLIGPSAEALVARDKAALLSLFSSISESENAVPHCDVLLLYATISEDGRVTGHTHGLRDIIREAEAPIVIVASPNEAKAYIAAAQSQRSPAANLVMTLDRKGEWFPRFFAQLFRSMFEGKTMPSAWVELAPQVPGLHHDGVPETIFAAEISHIVFKR